MFDTHCHLQTEQFSEDCYDVIRSAESAGVDQFLVPAIDITSFDGTLDLVKRFSNIYCALGIHPHSAVEWGEIVEKRIISEAATNTKIVAIGEIGLDYYYDFAPRAMQREVFRSQLILAQKLGKPVIIHTRDSIDETLDIVEECYKSRTPTYLFGQFHCFSGTVGQMERAVRVGFAVSFTGNITFKNSQLGDVVRQAPIDHILIETDSPYLAPVPHRGKRNTPENLPLVAAKVAELKNLDIKEVMTRTTQNAKKLFLPVLSLLVFFLISLFSEEVRAQVGSRPPDSVMTKERRDAEELIRKQREQMLRLEEERRQDSIRAAQNDLEERKRSVAEQQRRDSIKAAERIADEERARLKALTPIPWKAITLGIGGGIGNLELSQSKPRITPSAVFATSFTLGTQLSRIIDVELSYNSFKVEDDISGDRLFNFGDTTFTGLLDTSFNGRPKTSYNQPIHEFIQTAYYGIDFRFVFTPRSPLKFYAGLGYTATTITNSQTYNHLDTLGRILESNKTFENSFTRGGIKALIGARFDYELNDQFIVTPYAQIGAAFLFSGEGQMPVYTFRIDHEQIVFTHTTIGVTLSWGWFTVPRYN